MNPRSPIVRTAAFAAMALLPLVSFAAPPAAPGVTYPTVSVQNLKLEKSTYASGEVVKGTFLLLNNGKAAASDASYVVRVVGGYDKSGTWNAEYVRQTIKAPAVGSGQYQTIPVSIELPSGLAGELAIEVQAQLPSGALYGWTDASITVTGTNTFATLTNAFVAVGAKEFDVGDGPTIHEGEKGELLATLKNITGSALTLVPSIAVTKQGVAVGMNKAAPVTIPANGTSDIHLPISSTEPGVYTADVSFLDEAGKPHAQMVTYRYIIEGATATIQSVSADKPLGTTHDVVKVTTVFTGMPPDINPTNGSVRQDQATTTLNIVLYSERGTIVGGARKEVNLNTERTATLSIALTAPANALRADVVLTRDGKILSRVNAKLSPIFDTAAPIAASIIYGLGALVTLFVVTGVVCVARLRSGAGSRTRMGAIASFVLALALAVLLYFVYMGAFSLHGLKLGIAAHAEGGYYENYGDPGYDPNVYVNPDVCPLDDGEQLVGPCAHTLMNLVYVPDGGSWDYYMRNYLPYWNKSSDQINGQYVYFSQSISPQNSIPIVFKGYLWQGLLWQSTTSFDGTNYDQYLLGSASDPSQIYADTQGFYNASVPSVYIQPIVGPVHPGDQFTVEGLVSYPECTNTPIDMVIGAYFQGASELESFPSTVSGQSHTVYGSQKRFTFGPFTAPASAGTYRLDLDMGWKYNHFHPEYRIPFGSSNTGHIDIVVTDIPTFVDLTPGAMTPTTAYQNVPTTLTVPVINSRADPAGPSHTGFLIHGPDYSTQSHTEQSCYEVYTKEGATLQCDPYEVVEEFGFIDSKNGLTSAVAGNGSGAATLSYTFTQLGTYTIPQICVDSLGQVTETDESNNCTSATITVVPPTQCTDGIDNDGDGKIDSLDPGCSDPSDTTESPDPLVPPTVSLSVDKTSVNPGGSAKLTWTSENATSCTGTGFNTSNATANSTGVSTGALAAPGPYNYLITCTGPGGQATDAEAVSISNGTAYITANPNRVNVGASSNVSWSAAGITDSCTVTGTDGYTSGALPGPTIATTTVARTITHQTIYRITCGSITSQTIVNVNPKIEEF